MKRKKRFFNQDLSVLLNRITKFCILCLLVLVMSVSYFQPVSGQRRRECSTSTRAEAQGEIDRIKENLTGSRGAEIDNLLTTRGNFGKEFGRRGRRRTGRIPGYGATMSQDPAMRAMEVLAGTDTSDWPAHQRAAVWDAQILGQQNFQIDPYGQRDPSRPGGNSRRADEAFEGAKEYWREYIRRCFPEPEYQVSLDITIEITEYGPVGLFARSNLISDVELVENEAGNYFYGNSTFFINSFESQFEDKMKELCDFYPFSADNNHGEIEIYMIMDPSKTDFELHLKITESPTRVLTCHFPSSPDVFTFDIGIYFMAIFIDDLSAFGVQLLGDDLVQYADSDPHLVAWTQYSAEFIPGDGTRWQAEVLIEIIR